MNITPYSISESTKISEAYLNNVVVDTTLTEASAQWGNNTSSGVNMNPVYNTMIGGSENKSSSVNPSSNEYSKVFSDKPTSDINPYYTPPPKNPSSKLSPTEEKIVAGIEHGSRKLNSLAQDVYDWAKENPVEAGAEAALMFTPLGWVGKARHIPKLFKVAKAATSPVVNTAKKVGSLAKKAIPTAMIASDADTIINTASEHPYAGATIAGVASMNPKLFWDTTRKFLNSKWAWAYPLYYVGQGVVNGLNSASQPPAQPATQPPAQTASQPPAQTASQPPVQKDSQSNIANMKVPGFDDYSYRDLNRDIKFAKVEGIPSTGTNDVLQAVGNLTPEQFENEELVDIAELIRAARSSK